jgi:hypothetical protein
MTTEALREYFQRNPERRFSPQACRAAGLSLAEARLLKCLLLAERDNRWVSGHFGLGTAFNLLRHGLADNPLDQAGQAHTNLWRLTGAGEQKLGGLIQAEKA